MNQPSNLGSQQNTVPHVFYYETKKKTHLNSTRLRSLLYKILHFNVWAYCTTERKTRRVIPIDTYSLSMNTE